MSIHLGPMPLGTTCNQALPPNSTMQLASTPEDLETFEIKRIQK